MQHSNRKPFKELSLVHLGFCHEVLSTKAHGFCAHVTSHDLFVKTLNVTNMLKLVNTAVELEAFLMSQ